MGTVFFGIAVANHLLLKEPFIPELASQAKAGLSTSAEAKKETEMSMWKLAKESDILNIVTLHCGYWFVLAGSQMTILPLLLSGEVFQLGVSELGYTFAAMSAVNVIGTSLSGRLLDRFPKVNLILLASFTTGTAISLSSLFSALPQFLPCLFLWTASGTMLGSGPTAVVADR